MTSATDEDIGRLRVWSSYEPATGMRDDVAALIARIDAERAARERAEADLKEQGDRWKARAEKAERDADGWREWVAALTDRLDEALASLRWDNHDNWCPAATDAFLPYKKNPEAPPACNCWVSGSWAKVEGGRAALSQEKEYGK